MWDTTRRCCSFYNQQWAETNGIPVEQVQAKSRSALPLGRYREPAEMGWLAASCNALIGFACARPPVNPAGRSGTTWPLIRASVNDPAKGHPSPRPFA